MCELLPTTHWLEQRLPFRAVPRRESKRESDHVNQDKGAKTLAKTCETRKRNERRSARANTYVIQPRSPERPERVPISCSHTPLWHWPRFPFPLPMTVFPSYCISIVLKATGQRHRRLSNRSSSSHWRTGSALELTFWLEQDSPHLQEISSSTPHIDWTF